MSSAALEVQTAIFAILDADVTLSALTTGVFDDVPEGYTDFPYVTLGEDVLTELDTDSVLGFRVSVTIHSWSQYRGQKETKQVQDAIYRALHHADMTVNGYDVILSRLVDQTSERDPDGLTRHGVQTFELLLRAPPASSVLSPLNPDLVAMYTMDNVIGSTLFDESPNGVNGVITGATFQAGHIGDSIKLAGGTDKVLFGNAANFGADDSFAVSMWVKAGAQATANTISIGKFNANIGWKIVVGTDGKIHPQAQDGAASVAILSNLSVSPSTFIHVICNFDKAGRITVYGDNVFISQSASLLSALGSLASAGGSMVIGNKNTDWTDGTPFVGELDHVRVFKRIFNAAERTTLYNNGVGA